MLNWDSVSLHATELHHSLMSNLASENVMRIVERVVLHISLQANFIHHIGKPLHRNLVSTIKKSNNITSASTDICSFKM